MRACVFVLVLLFVLLGSGVLLFGRNIDLVATARLEVLAEPASDARSIRTLALLEAGDRVVVVACKDMKHYLVPEVQLPDGRRGYVLQGQFELSPTESLSLTRPLVWSCP